MTGPFYLTVTLPLMGKPLQLHLPDEQGPLIDLTGLAPPPEGVHSQEIDRGARQEVMFTRHQGTDIQEIEVGLPLVVELGRDPEDSAKEEEPDIQGLHSTVGTGDDSREGAPPTIRRSHHQAIGITLRFRFLQKTVSLFLLEYASLHFKGKSAHIRIDLVGVHSSPAMVRERFQRVSRLLSTIAFLLRLR